MGLGKTLSLGTAALALCLLQDQAKAGQKPVVIFAPATLCEQWQTEMIDKPGIPCARWETQKKVWLDHEDRAISPAGREQIARCPLRIGIVSTGLMMRDSSEKRHLLGLRFGLVILDEAHKARSRQGFGGDAGTPNELLAFSKAIAERSDHVLLGTATPIQTRSEDLWDLMRILHQGKGRFVLGNDYARWHRPDAVLPIISGQTEVVEPDLGWELLRSPLPVVNSTDEPRARKLFSAIRQDLGLPERQTECGATLIDLSDDTREIFGEELEREMSGASFSSERTPSYATSCCESEPTLKMPGYFLGLASICTLTGNSSATSSALMPCSKERRFVPMMISGKRIERPGLSEKLSRGEARAADS